MPRSYRHMKEYEKEILELNYILARKEAKIKWLEMENELRLASS